MKQSILILFFIGVYIAQCYSQVVVPVILPVRTSENNKRMYFGLKKPHDLEGRKLCLVFQDDRLSFKKSFCSTTKVTDGSKFDGEYGMTVMKKYFDTLVGLSNGLIDTSGPLITISLQALQHKIKGELLPQEAHGICQIMVEHDSFKRTYCVDLKDDDPSSPMEWDDTLTRESIARIMMSGALRDVIEKIITEIPTIL